MLSGCVDYFLGKALRNLCSQSVLMSIHAALILSYCTRADSSECQWTPYVFYQDGRLKHTGTNIFNMWKTKEKGWMITGIADIAREVDEKAFNAFGEAEAWKESQNLGNESKA